MYFLHDTYKNCLFFLSFILLCPPASSANLPDSLINSTAIIRSFEANKVINTSPNYSLLFDNTGIMYLGQQDKINIYNGISWSQVHLNGEILLALSESNIIYFTGDKTIGYLSPDSSLKIVPRFLNQYLPENLTKTFKPIGIESVGFTVYFQSDSILLSYNSKQFKVLDSSFHKGKIFKCGNRLITLKAGNYISVYTENKLDTSLQLNVPEIVTILEHESGYLFITKNHSHFTTDFGFQELNKWPDFTVNDISFGLFLNTNEYLFSDSQNNLFLCDKNGIKKSVFNTAFDIPASAITKIIQEQSGNIWLLQDKSLTRIEYPSAIESITVLPNNAGNIRDLKTFENRIYIGGTRGLYYLNLNDNHLTETSLSGFCYQLIPTSKGLFAITNNEVFFGNDILFKSVLKAKIIDQHWNDSLNRLYLTESNKIVVLSFGKNDVIDSFTIDCNIKPQKICSLGEELWISDGISLYQYKKINSSNVSPIKYELPESNGIVEIFNWKNKIHILTDEKLYSFESGSFTFERSLCSELCNGEFLSATEDRFGNIWFLFRNSDKNSVIWFGNNEDKSFKKVILPSYISLTNPSIDYIGGNKLVISAGRQVFIIDLTFFSIKPRQFYTILKEIAIGDQILYKGISYDYFRVPMRLALNDIPFNKRNLRIELSSTNYLDNKVKYQYLLSGEDKIWSEWSNNSYIIFNNLHEGLYELKIRSKDYLNDTSAVTTLIFRVTPPFYRTWWAYLIYIIVGGILLFIGYKSYLLNIHNAQGRIQKRNNLEAGEQVPIIFNNVDPASSNKKYDFFSNIDEEKNKDKTRWDKYEMVTVLFSDIQGFTKIAESMNPELLIDELDRFFFHFDSVVEKYSIEKIKTIGDAYMAAGGIPKKSITNPIEVVLAALEMQNYMKQLKKTKIDIWDLRIGIHSGPVIAGIIGHKKRSFDIWGDTVNTASRMESTGEAGKVNISSETYKLVKDYFICEYRGRLPVKYKGNIDMYFVKGLRPELSINLVGLPNRKFFLKLQLLRLTDLEEFIMSKLEAELNKNLFFHNLEYSKHIFEHSGLLAKAAELDLEETLCLRTAILFLNTGFIGGYDNHENRSAEYSRIILPEYNYSEKQISIVSNLILSSKWPPDPKNMLEMVMYDTKMEYIGRADYIRLYKLIFLEQNHFQKSVDVLEFKRKQLEILQTYSFFTESARRLREISLEDQVQRIRDDDWKN